VVLAGGEKFTLDSAPPPTD